MALLKGYLLNIWIDSETCHVTLSVCLSHCLSLAACLSASLLYIFLSVCVCLALCVCLSTCLSMIARLSVSLQPICQPVLRPVPLLICLSSLLHLFLPACLPVCLPVCLSACLSLPVCLSAHLLVCLSVSICLFVSLNIDNLQNMWDRVLWQWIRDVCDFKGVTCTCLNQIHTLYVVRTFLRGRRDSIPVGWDVLVIDRFWLDRVCCWLCFPITRIRLLTCSSVTFGLNWRKQICILGSVLWT